MGKPTAAMRQGGSFLLYDQKGGDGFWEKAETLLYCALIAYIVFEGPQEERNINTLVDMINSMEVKEDDENFRNAVDYMFMGLEKRKPQHFAVRQYKKFRLASGVVSCKRLIHHKLVNNTFTAYFIYGGKRNERNQNHAAV